MHRAVGRRGGVRRGSGISHVTAHAEAEVDADAATAAASSAAASATSAADSDNVVIAPVHPPAAQKTTFPVLLPCTARSTRTILSRAAPSRTSADQPRPLKHLRLPRRRLHVAPRGIDGSISRRGQLRRDRIVFARPCFATVNAPIARSMIGKSVVPLLNGKTELCGDHQRYGPFVIGVLRWKAENTFDTRIYDVNSDVPLLMYHSLWKLILKKLLRNLSRSLRALPFYRSHSTLCNTNDRQSKQMFTVF